MGNQNGLVTTPGITALRHTTGDCGVECDTAGKKFYVNVAGSTVFETSGTQQKWKGHSAFAGSDIIRVSGAVRTTDNTVTTLLSVEIPSGYAVFANAFVGCKQVDESDGCAYRVLGAAVNAAGSTSLLGTQNLVAVESASGTSATVVFDVNDSLDTLRVRVTGISAETWDWVGYVEYFMVNSST